MLHKIDPKLLNIIRIQGDSGQKCIIRFNSKEEAMQYLEKNKIDSYEYFDSIKSLAVELRAQNIYSLASQSCVEYISSVSKVCAMVNVAKKIIGVPKKSIVSDFSIAIIDTGIYPHLDIMLGNRAKIVEFVDLVSSKNTIYDDNGHGTFIATLLAGNGIISDKIYEGVDKSSNLIIIKALDQNGETTAVNILKAMQWIYDNKEKYNIKIACMSFGSAVLEINDPLILGAEALWDKGVTVVTACGNSGPEASTIKSPSASKKVISVGALDDNRIGQSFSIDRFKVADFSSRGPILGNYKPDIIVSGVEVVSACNFGIYKKFYNSMSGTSVATPIVAGVVSRLIKKYPNHTPDQIKKVLINNCRPITGDRNSEGYGWLDLHNIFN